jgi:hypothetical protein
MSKPKQPTKQTGTRGKVGIFWVFKENVLADTWPLQEGEKFDDFINGRNDHVDFWPKLQIKHPELLNLEYQDVPRGRVIFKKTKRTFSIYLDKVLLKPSIKKEIRRKFDLPVANSKFLTDAHYTTKPEAIENLFSGL